jgi:DNA-binding GntR family transcriptional regulator
VYTGPDTETAGEQPGGSPARASRSELAYGELKRRLLLGEFPLRDRLGESKLAALLEVSRTPVREALARLHAEGLVERHPEGGYRPSPPDLHHTHELYQVRFALEYHALHLPAEAGTTHDGEMLHSLYVEWAELAAARDVPIDATFVLLDEDFHVRLAAAAGNAALVETLITVNERIRPVRMHDFLTAERVEVTIEQHLGILDALLDGDLPLTRQRLDHHLRQSLDIVESRAAQALARMVSPSRPAVSPEGAHP